MIKILFGNAPEFEYQVFCKRENIKSSFGGSNPRLLLFHGIFSFFLAICARLLHVIQTKSSIIKIVGSLYRVSVKKEPKRSYATRHCPLLWTDFSIESPSANFVFTRHQRGISIWKFIEIVLRTPMKDFEILLPATLAQGTISQSFGHELGLPWVPPPI